MATGRVDVFRRRDSNNYSKREYQSYKNGVCRVEVVDGRRDGGRSRHGFHSSSRGLSNGSELRVKDAKTRKSETVVQLPPEKKRKCSPIIWDREEKEVRVSSKNRVVPVIPLSTPQLSLAGLSAGVPEVVADGGVLKSLASVIQSPEVEVSELKSSVVEGLVRSSHLEAPAPADLSRPMQAEQAQKNMEDKEFSQKHNISSSRWASDSDSPRDTSGDTPSSPESGEIRREGSGGSWSRTSSSDKEGSLARSSNGDKYYGEESCDEDMGIDNNNGDSAVDQLDYDSEDDIDLPLIEGPAVPRQRSINMLQCCRSVFEYEKLNKINEGTYGIVYKARDKKTGEFVALKKVKMDADKGGDGFPITALREINILLSINHPSVVGVKEVVMDDFDEVYMVMEYMEYDLKGLIGLMKQPFSMGEIKWLMLQLLQGVEYLHDNWVLHRDLKASNLLLNKEGELKICDFGMSRQYGSPLKPYTSLVVTLWYRAPEILLGTKQYSTAIDMWSVGCIMAELLAKEPLFNGKTEADQLDKIFRTLGTPDEKSGLCKLPGFKANFVKQPYNYLRKKFPAASFTGSSPVLSESGFDLLKNLLSYNPAERITAKAALNHAWFHESPEPRSDFRPNTPDLHVLDRYRSRKAV